MLFVGDGEASGGGGGGGITQLTGEVLAGPGSGSQVATVIGSVIDGSTAGTVNAGPGDIVVVDLDTAGGDVSIQPAGIGFGVESFQVICIGTNVGGFTLTVLPMAGGRIESVATPGTLVASFPDLGNFVPGERFTFASYNAIDLYY